MTLIYAALVSVGVTTAELALVVMLIPRVMAKAMAQMLRPPTKATGSGPIGGMTTTTNNLS